MRLLYTFRMSLLVLLIAGLSFACDNEGGDDDDDDDVEHITESEFEADREESLNRLDDYLDSLTYRKQALANLANGSATGATDSVDTDNYESAIQNIESTRVSIREQYGKMQNLSNEDWQNIASMVRKALAGTDDLVMNGSNASMGTQNDDSTSMEAGEDMAEEMDSIE